MIGLKRMPARSIRDFIRRKVFEKCEVEREALRYIMRNPEYPFEVRTLAKTKLEKLPTYAHPTGIHNRCLETGRGRGVFSAFKMARYPLRERILKNLVPGTKKASW
ncbi:mitochondrial 37S ribosomal protein MRP2 [Schizosaccharomyces japonicus yFS275]|uniref:Ribosomal protein subunit S14 n=1 Tax=Schizosaccharomyces japonicus (strain yFS275 / FY16936) TaxID=402676 RepID=B6K2I2_SCHJY|nr:mitochondrial 37S ribosomal protein MRP2 [Schizosaccharomyces japonicus yFS275]EEB07363.2 ribosomal protein subunit S14 [Schizosaccharomyces japonicus yFS275]